MFRRAIEEAVRDRHGEVDLYHGAIVHTACRFEQAAQLAQRWLLVSPDLTPSEKLAFAKTIAYASDNRDRCLKSLGLDLEQRHTIANLYEAPPQRPPEPASEPPGQEATETAPTDRSASQSPSEPQDGQ